MPASRLRDPAAQMDWDDFLRLIERAKDEVGDDSGMEEAAFQLLLRNTTVRGLASAFADPRELLLKIPAFMGRSLYTHIVGYARPSGENQVLFHHIIPADCRSSSLFLRMSRGLLRAYPCLLGLPEADVQMNADLHHAVFRVTLPARRKAGPGTRHPGLPLEGNRLYVVPGEGFEERYLDIFNDPGGNLARIRYCTERLSVHDNLAGFVHDLMRLLREVCGCSHARLWL
ncbi:MAG TPA: hypothetical protein VN436_03730, partial [Holophaga sp.]|nr:hypothetical protein [Holophaga sp.]